MTRPLLLITWRDHYSTSEWKTPEELQNPEVDLNRSVGWLVAEDDQRLTIVQTVGDTLVRDSLTIEKACLEKRRVLR